METPLATTVTSTSQAAAEGSPTPTPPVGPSTPTSTAASEAEPTNGAEPTARELSEFARRRHGLSEKAKAVAERERALAEREAASKDHAAKLEAAAKRIAELEEQVTAWKRAPLDQLEDPSKAVREYVEKTSPERMVHQLSQDNRELRAELAKLREDITKTIAEKEAAFRKEGDEQRAQALKAQEAHERKVFTSTLRSKAAEFPFIHAEYEDAEIEAMAAEIQAWAAANKKQVTFSEAATFLNSRAKAVYESREERRKLITSPEADAASPGTERRAKESPPGSGPRAERPPTRTTSRATLSRKEQEAEDLSAIRTAMEKDRLSREKGKSASRS